MTNDTDFIQSIIDGLKAVAGDQRKLDAVYSELVKKMKTRLKEVNNTGQEKGQPWFTREPAGLRKVMLRCEKKWLRSVSNKDRRTFRREYIQSRQSYFFFFFLFFFLLI